LQCAGHDPHTATLLAHARDRYAVLGLEWLVRHRPCHRNTLWDQVLHFRFAAAHTNRKKTAQTFRAHARSKGVSIDLANIVEIGFFNGNGMLCETIIENILRNDIEVSPDGASVTISNVETSRFGITVHNKSAAPPNMIQSFFHKYATSKEF
jgi:hypothetical protein